MDNPYESPQTEQLPSKSIGGGLLYCLFMSILLPVVIGGTEIAMGRVINGFCWAIILLCAEANGLCVGVKLLSMAEESK